MTLKNWKEDLYKHSPAPWEQYEDDDGNVIIRMDKAHEVFVTNMEGSCGTCHANANLIEAAPELLEVLEGIINCPFSVDEATVPLAGIDANREQVVLEYSISLARIDKAKAIIAKIRNIAR